MSQQIPVVDLEVALGEVAPAGLLDAVRSAAEHVGVIQVVNHGVPGDLLADFIRRMGHLLSLPRADKARLASPGGHPYRGWRQWPDDYGRLELERYNVAQFDTPADARAAGVSAEYLGLYVHPNVWPPDDPQLRAAARSPVSRLPAGWRSACPSCTPGRSVSPRIPSRSAPPRTPPPPPAPAAHHQRLPHLVLPGRSQRRGQAAPVRARRRLGADRADPGRRLRGAPGAAARWRLRGGCAPSGTAWSPAAR
jgi:hypothetical protein